ncbi:hypothetical protein C8R45DRAFT_946780 [Mycena sanguinolenta]|nr:hypothetical protein C8R45DRAFT_946780 [Mycena sanguinolenta]
MAASQTPGAPPPARRRKVLLPSLMKRVLVEDCHCATTAAAGGAATDTVKLVLAVVVTVVVAQLGGGLSLTRWAGAEEKECRRGAASTSTSLSPANERQDWRPTPRTTRRYEYEAGALDVEPLLDPPPRPNASASGPGWRCGDVHCTEVPKGSGSWRMAVDESWGRACSPSVVGLVRGLLVLVTRRRQDHAAPRALLRSPPRALISLLLLHFQPVHLLLSGALALVKVVHAVRLEELDNLRRIFDQLEDALAVGEGRRSSARMRSPYPHLAKPCSEELDDERVGRACRDTSDANLSGRKLDISHKYFGELFPNAIETSTQCSAVYMDVVGS